jgi:hypothetical protein
MVEVRCVVCRVFSFPVSRTNFRTAATVVVDPLLDMLLSL